MGPRGGAGTGQKQGGSLKDAVRAGVLRRYQEAAAILERLSADPAAEPESRLYLGRALHALGDYPRALGALNSYIRLRPRNFQGYLFAGRTLLALGRYGPAAGSLRRALALKPRDVQSIALLGAVCLKARRPAQAAALLEQAVKSAAAGKLSPKDQRRIYQAYINALLIRGIRLIRQGDYDRGLRMLRFVLEKGKDIPLLRLEMGRACRETGNGTEALEHYSRALEFAPGDRRIRWFRASILISLGRKQEALEEIQELRRGDPGAPELPWNSGTVDLYLAQSYLENGEWRRAAAACKTLLRKNPGGLAHALYAEALRNLGNYPAALNHLELARKTGGDRPEYQYARLLCAWEGEDWETMRKAIAHLKTLGGDQGLLGRFETLCGEKQGRGQGKHPETGIKEHKKNPGYCETGENNYNSPCSISGKVPGFQFLGGQDGSQSNGPV
jgi:tetratricopeptide (TPR) repeat protein